MAAATAAMDKRKGDTQVAEKTAKGKASTSTSKSSKKSSKSSSSSSSVVRPLSWLVLLLSIAAGVLLGTESGQQTLIRYGVTDKETLTSWIDNFTSTYITGSTHTVITDEQTDEPESIATSHRQVSQHTIIPVEVFQNAMSDGGIAFNFTAAEHGQTADIGMVISDLHGCTNYMDPRGPEDPGFCKVHNQLGRRVRLFDDINPHDRLYLVPHDRLFIFPAVSLGHKFELPHITTPKGATVMLETLSDSPKVFKLYNFMDDAEADQIIQDALKITDDAHKLKRSSTGTKGNDVSVTRTSENAFVTGTETAMAIKTRIFDLLGIEVYNEHWADGLQVLRYNVSKAYIAHLDYLEAVEGEHDFDSGGYGINRFATVVLYFSDVEEGGETVFTRADIPGTPGAQTYPQAIEALRAEKGEMLEKIGIRRGSWEEQLVTQCNIGLAVKPRRGDAVLFYSQLPNGSVDDMSEHGACPVIEGTKWAANLWVWNGPRYGYTIRDPKTGRSVEADYGSDPHFAVSAVFANSDDGPNAMLYYEDQLWESFEPGKVIRVNSFIGHTWNVKYEGTGQLIRTWRIEKRERDQVFHL